MNLGPLTLEVCQFFYPLTLLRHFCLFTLHHISAIGELLTKMATKFKAIEVEKWEFFEQFNDNTAYALGITKHAMQPDGKTFRRNK